MRSIHTSAKRCLRAEPRSAAFGRRRGCRGPRWAEARFLPLPKRRQREDGPGLVSQASAQCRGHLDSCGQCLSAALQRLAVKSCREPSEFGRSGRIQRYGEPERRAPAQPFAHATRPRPASRSEANQRRRQQRQRRAKQVNQRRRHTSAIKPRSGSCAAATPETTASTTPRPPSSRPHPAPPLRQARTAPPSPPTRTRPVGCWRR